MYSKKLKISIFQMAKFLTIWKTVSTTLFSDIKINMRFRLYNKTVKLKSTNKTNIDKFKLKFIKKKKTFYMGKFKKSTATNFTPKQLFNVQANPLKLKSHKKKVSNTTSYTFLKLLDINGELLNTAHFNSLKKRVSLLRKPCKISILKLVILKLKEAINAQDA